MSSKRTLLAGHIFDEIDTDRSGSWNHREFYLAGLRSLKDGPAISADVHKFYTVILNCTTRMIADEKFNLENVPLVEKNRLLKCPEAVNALVDMGGKRRRFKFRLGDAEVR